MAGARHLASDGRSCADRKSVASMTDERSQPSGLTSTEKSGVPTRTHKFMSITSKGHAQIAGEMVDEIKAVIYKHSNVIPLALALGVLRIVELEIFDANE